MKDGMVEATPIPTSLQLKSHNRLTLPASIAAEAVVGPGDDLLFEVRNGDIILISAEIVPRDEVYLLTPQWREAIAVAQEDIAAGRVESADCFAEMFRKFTLCKHYILNTFHNN